MVLSHQKIDLEDKLLIEKIVIQAPFRFTTDLHNEACFIYYSEGRTMIHSPYEQEWIGPEESVLLRCGPYFSDLLHYSTADRYEILVFHLYPDLLRKIYLFETPAFLKQTQKKFIHKGTSGIVTKKFVEGLYFYFDHPELISDELLRLKIQELILLLVQSRNAESIFGLFSVLFSPQTINIKEVVNSHLFSSISIEDLAGLCQLSVSSFNRSFQTLFNDTPANYIRGRRLERAKHLLTVSSLTVSEIAFQTCFMNVAHFSRSFTAAYGKSPSAYRASLKKT